MRALRNPFISGVEKRNGSFDDTRLGRRKEQEQVHFCFGNPLERFANIKFLNASVGPDQQGRFTAYNPKCLQRRLGVNKNAPEVDRCRCDGNDFAGLLLRPEDADRPVVDAAVATVVIIPPSPGDSPPPLAGKSLTEAKPN